MHVGCADVPVSLHSLIGVPDLCQKDEGSAVNSGHPWATHIRPKLDRAS
jgi:hypothetical protein